MGLSSREAHLELIAIGDPVHGGLLAFRET
jgi:hypothetical protein